MRAELRFSCEQIAASALLVPARAPWAKRPRALFGKRTRPVSENETAFPEPASSKLTLQGFAALEEKWERFLFCD